VRLHLSLAAAAAAAASLATSKPCLIQTPTIQRRYSPVEYTRALLLRRETRQATSVNDRALRIATSMRQLLVTQISPFNCACARSSITSAILTQWCLVFFAAVFIQVLHNARRFII
jgi:hypothetical protein